MVLNIVIEGVVEKVKLASILPIIGELKSDIVALDDILVGVGGENRD